MHKYNTYGNWARAGVIAGLWFLLGANCSGGSDSTSNNTSGVANNNPAPSGDTAGRYTLATPFDAQQTDSWCWAASEQMVLATYGFQYSQAEIVTATYGAVVDSGGTAQQIQAGLISLGGLPAQVVSGPLTFQQIQTLISQGTPVIVQYESPYLNEGHFVVIYGYTSDGNLLIDDPILGQFNVPYGSSFEYGAPGGPLVWFLSIFV